MAKRKDSGKYQLPWMVRHFFELDDVRQRYTLKSVMMRDCPECDAGFGDDWGWCWRCAGSGVIEPEYPGLVERV